MKSTSILKNIGFGILVWSAGLSYFHEAMAATRSCEARVVIEHYSRAAATSSISTTTTVPTGSPSVSKGQNVFTATRECGKLDAADCARERACTTAAEKARDSITKAIVLSSVCPAGSSAGVEVYITSTKGIGSGPNARREKAAIVPGLDYNKWISCSGAPVMALSELCDDKKYQQEVKITQQRFDALISAIKSKNKAAIVAAYQKVEAEFGWAKDVFTKPKDNGPYDGVKSCLK